MADEIARDGAADGSLRLFYALWPDEPTRAWLAARQDTLAGRRTNPRNLHLTLAFLGQQAGATVPLLKNILGALPRRRFDLLLDRAGYFPRNRIAWVGASATPPELADLYQCLLRELERAAIAFKPSARFKPHITLARDAAAGPPAVLEPLTWPVRTVALVHSVTGSGPAQYRLLASHALDGGGQ